MPQQALTEAVYYILLSLQKPLHGYGIIQVVGELSGGRVKLAPGTLYGALNSLVDKGLLEEAGRIDVPGHPIGYQTTPLFLRAFGLSSLEELPEPKRRQQETFTGELDGFTAEQTVPEEPTEPEEEA